MGKFEVNALSATAKSEFDLEARWRGELGAQERQELKAWHKKACEFGLCELKIGKQRSRLAIRFDRLKIESKARQDMGKVEVLLRGQTHGSESIDSEAANAIAVWKSADANSSQGLLLKDYGEVLARDWALQSSAALQSIMPGRCGLKVSLGKSASDSSMVGQGVVSGA